MKTCLRLEIELLFPWSKVPYNAPVKGCEMDEKDVWATELARKVLERKNKEELQMRSSLAERERIASKAPEMWDDLVNEVKSRAAALNLALGQNDPVHFQQLEMYKFDLSTRKGAYRISFEFNPRSTRLDVRSNTAVEYEIGILDGTLTWVNKSGGTTSQQIAKRAVEDASLYV